MKSLHIIPDYIEKELKLMDIQNKDIHIAVLADMDVKGLFNENWIILTNELLLRISGNTVKIKNAYAPYKKKSDEMTKFNVDSIEKYELEKLENILIDEFISGGLLSGEYDGKHITISRFTNKHKGEFNLLVKYIGKVKKNEEIDQNELMEEKNKFYCPKCGRPYPDQSMKTCPKCLDKRSLFIRVLSFMNPYKWKVTAIIILMLISSLFSIVSPFLEGKFFFDQVLNENGSYYGKIIFAIFAIVSARLFTLIFYIIYARINAFVTANIIYDIKSRIFNSMQRLSLKFYSDRRTGNLMTRINGDTMELQYFFHDGMPYFVTNIIKFIGVTISIMIIDYKLALLVLIPFPFAIFFTKYAIPKLHRLYGRRFRKRSSLNSIISDALTGARIVKAFGKEKNEIERFDYGDLNLRTSEKEIGLFTSTTMPLVNSIVGLGTFIVWIYGGLRVISGDMTFGTLISFNAYLASIYGPLMFLADIYDWWSYSMNASKRIFEVIDANSEIVEKQNPLVWKEVKGSIGIKNISFEYEVNKPVIHEISLDINAGETVGIVGKSGAGKSTIANLLMRLYDVTEGKIIIDGMDIRDYSLKSLHDNIGMVLQDTYLFNGSVADNIRYTKEDASLQEVIMAAKYANCHDFIMKLPDGYDTIVGKNGHDLSGGEKQRVSIARTVLHNPKIIILDEATASVDTKTEIQIQSALEGLLEGRTSIVIAHRLSTLRNADKIVVIEDGKLVETGTPKELLDKKGKYYEMLKKQSEALRLKEVI